MKHVKLYEEFDLDKFLEDPEGNIHDDENPEIEEGDWISSYRGIGQVMVIPKDPNGFYKVQLLNKTMANVPQGMATKIKKEDAQLASVRDRETSKEIDEISKDLENYLDSIRETQKINNLESAFDFLEDILIKLIDINKKNPHISYNEKYPSIIMSAGSISDIILSSTNDRNFIERIKKLNEAFYKLSD